MVIPSIINDEVIIMKIDPGYWLSWVTETMESLRGGGVEDLHIGLLSK